MKKTALLVLLAAFTGLASATTITSHNNTIDLEKGQINASIQVEDMSSSVFYYTTSYPVQNLEASINGRPAECNVEPLPPGSYITCETDLRSFKAHLSFNTEGLTTERNGINIFRYTKNIQRPTENYSLKVFLPQGSGLLGNSNVSMPILKPDTAVIDTDGRRIFVEWSEKPGLGQISFQALYSQPDSRKEGLPLVAILVPVLLLALGISVSLAWRAREDLDEVYEEVSEDEEEVLDMVRDNEFSMLQKDIVDQSEYSKAKISSVVSNLEEKGVIKKKKEGRSNKVTIPRKYRF
ncbi:MAG: hypothetical protein ABEJ93_04780 [Candidatus Nanohalobium sp.]